MPAWAPEHLADMGSTAQGKKAQAVKARFRQQAVEHGLAKAVDGLLESEDAMDRRFGVLLLVATDDLDKMSDLLITTTHQDIWDAAIVAMRNWIGRGPGQDQKLYQRLVEQAQIFGQ